MKKIISIVVLGTLLILTSCSKESSLSGTRWEFPGNSSVVYSYVSFFDGSTGEWWVKGGGTLSFTYKYNPPGVVLYSSNNKPIAGTISGDYLTLTHDGDSITFIKQ